MMMKKTIFCAIAALMLMGCQKSLEDRAEQEARDYTRKFCPTPVHNHTRTDSLVFDRQSLTFIYYCTLTDFMDDAKLIEENRQMLTDGLRQSIQESTGLKVYKDAGYSFRYVLRSEKSPDTILYESTFQM